MKEGSLKSCRYGSASLLVAILLLSTFAYAQTDQNVRESDYKADQVLKSRSMINPSTLALEFALPVGGYKGRAGSGLPISISYSSKVWQMYSVPGGSWEHQTWGIVNDVKPMFAQRTAGGWSSSLSVPRINYTFSIYEPFRSNVSNYDGQVFDDVGWLNPPNPPDSYSIYYIKRVHVTMPDGSSHEFRKDDSKYSYGTSTSPGGTGLPDFTGTFLSVDGSRMKLELGASSSTLYLPNGSRYLFGAKTSEHKAYAFIDVHGNKMTFNDTNKEWTDTLGRVITDPMPSNWDPFEQNQTAGDEVVEFPGFDGGTYDVTFEWRYLIDPGSGEDAIDNPSDELHYLSDYYCNGYVKYATPGPNLFSTPEPTMTRVCAPGVTSADPPFNPIVLAAIELPNGQSYQFRYNVYGEITRITYPTGSYERFAYEYIDPVQGSNASYDQANRGVSDRWISEKGDGTDEIHWQYSAGKTYGNPYTVEIVAPDGTKTEQFLHSESSSEPQPYGFGDAKTGRAYEDRVLSSQDVLLRRSLTKYTQTGPLSGGVSYASRDMRPEKQVSITIEPGESNALAQLMEFVYDSNADPEYFAELNPTQVKTYHYKVISLSTAQNSDIDTIAALFSSSDLATVKETDYIYDSNYKSRNITSLVTETRIKDASGNVKAKTQITYDESSYWLTSSGSMPTAAAGSWVDPQTNYRGLATTAKGYYDISGNGFITTHSFYDQYGNVRKIRDGEGYDTEAQYSADFAFAYQTSTITPVPDSTGVKGSNTAFTSTSDYDYQTGLVLSTVDPNGIENLFEYDDPLLRPTEVSSRIASTQTPVGSVTQTIYGAGTSSSTRFVKVRSQIDEDNWQESYSWYDGLGRTIKTQSVNSEGDIFVETEYDDLSRVKKVSNPYRSGETVYWTENTFDDLSRVVTVTTLDDSSEVNTAFSLATSGDEIGTVVTVTDQAGKLRRSVRNALGELIRVDEPNASNQLGTISSPNQDTLYSYDTLTNLVSVVQGVQTRTFEYDALSRLVEATNPESGTISYSYDDNSNLVSKTDARNITTDYEYDTLNRIKKREYSDTVTPTVDYYYDNLTNAKGRLVKVANSYSTTEHTEFDPLGRITKSKQTTDGTVYNQMEYAYSLSGALIEETYPSGRKVKNILDNDGELSIVSSRKDASSGYWNYASSFQYSAAGAVTRMQLGNGTWESTTFNSRLQPEQIALGTTPAATNLLKLDYTYESTSGGDNNGNILTQKITVPDVGAYQGFVADQTYNYDPVNRLASAEEKIDQTTSWKQTFSYDRYGNRNFNENPSNTTTLTWGCGNPTGTEICDSDRMRENPEIEATTNRIKVDQTGGTSTDYGFDSAGNMTLDPDGRQFTYDGESKQIKVENSSDEVIGEYFYDGDGNRVMKKVPIGGGSTETTVFVYDAGGKLVAEYSTTVASSQYAQISYLTNDHLGSPRILTDKNGKVSSRRDFMPFGEEITSTVTTERSTHLNYGSGLDDGVRQKFTSYERDNESSLDFAQARMYNYQHGRFTAVDPLLVSANPSNPQSWNRFIYCFNNPLIFIDPSGEIVGDYYDKEGKWLFTDNINDDKVYLATPTTTAEGATNYEVQDLGITHTQFKIISNIVRQEGATDDTNEYLWIAHASNNRAGALNKSLYGLLMSGFSSVGNKSGLSTKDGSLRANAARAGVIDVLSGGADPTSGAQFWDGTDFLAWGLNSPNGTPHNKFEEHDSIVIREDVFNSYLSSQGSSSARYRGRQFPIPADVFNRNKNPNNWGTWTRDGVSESGFRYRNNNGRGVLYATGTAGKSIFWSINYKWDK